MLSKFPQTSLSHFYPHLANLPPAKGPIWNGREWHSHQNDIRWDFFGLGNFHAIPVHPLSADFTRDIFTTISDSATRDPTILNFLRCHLRLSKLEGNCRFRSSSLEREISISRDALHARIQFPQENRITDRITNSDYCRFTVTGKI